MKRQPLFPTLSRWYKMPLFPTSHRWLTILSASVLLLSLSSCSKADFNDIDEGESKQPVEVSVSLSSIDFTLNQATVPEESSSVQVATIPDVSPLDSQATVPEESSSVQVATVPEESSSGITSINALLMQAEGLPLTPDARYLCEDGQKSFSFALGTTISTAGTRTTTYRLRLVKTLRLRVKR